jgi:hypothetical protein
MRDLLTITSFFLIESTQPDIITKLMTEEKELNESEDDNFENDTDKNKTTNEDNSSKSNSLKKKEKSMSKRMINRFKQSTLNQKIKLFIKRSLNVNSDSETSRLKLSKQRHQSKSMSDAMIEIQLMKFKDFETNQARLQRKSDLDYRSN